nr:ras-like GTP-binding protein rhoA [Rhipicephalus microplus]
MERLELCYFFRSSPFIIGDGAASGIGRARKQCLDHDRSWPPSQPAIDVISMCLRIDSSDSCVNIMVSERWQLRHFCGSVPVLVGIRKCFLEQPSHVLEHANASPASNAPVPCANGGRRQDMPWLHLECSAKIKDS